jgi:predicted MFS family arabinose efflux permease
VLSVPLLAYANRWEVAALGRPEELQPGKRNRLPSTLWAYGLFTFLSVTGFANFQIISYHLTTSNVVPAEQIPILYAIAMGVDALVALVVGKAYDRAGLVSLVVVPFLVAPLPFLAFSSTYALAVAGAVLWGAIMAIQETTMRAAIADITPVDRRAFAYGIFNTIYGAAWFVGGAVIGFLCERSSARLPLFIIVVEVVALGVFLSFHRARRTQEAPNATHDQAVVL